MSGLKPISAERFGGAQRTHAAETEAAALRLQLQNPRGGMRVPHIHVGDDIFLVDAERWQKFSSHVMSDLGQKLQQAGKVSFRQLANATETVHNLA